jgi:CheY-like chemotaxis protein
MTPLKRILLVDDDSVTNMLHRRVIERSGLVELIDVATDGREALELLGADLTAERALPELIFLDINMPGMGGFEFLEHYADLPVGPDAQLIIVMLSTSLLPNDHARARNDPNVHSFCEKPLSLRELLTVVEEFQNRQDGRRSVA